LEGLKVRVRDLALEARRVPGTEPASDAAGRATPVFTKEGEFWTVIYGDRFCRLKDRKGLGYIAHLLQHPGVEFHSLDLIAEIDASAAAVFQVDGANSAEGYQSALADVGRRSGISDDAGEMLDNQAKAAYKHKRAELIEELQEANELHQVERADTLREEIEALNKELLRAVGLRGRDRKAASASERARLAVTRAIKAAIERITDNNPALGAMLIGSIRTGTFCSYAPKPRAIPATPS
jgi:hypothetical protein